MSDREAAAVRRFHERFRQLAPLTPGHLTRRKLFERVVSMLEEVAEFAVACGIEVESHAAYVDPDDGFIKQRVDFPIDLTLDGYDQDLEAQFDALLDLVYFAKGTVVMLGLDGAWEVGFDEVQRANMDKVPGLTHRGFLADVTKPEGWRPPGHATILFDAGYQRELWEGADGRIDEAVCHDDPIHKEAAE